MSDETTKPTPEGMGNRPTKEELEIQKIKTEIKLNRQKIQAEKRSNKLDLFERLKESLGVLATTFGIVIALIAVFKGIDEYRQAREAERSKQEKEMQLEFRSDMVELVEKLGNDSSSAPAIVMLKYFGKDAIPILTFKLERVKIDKAQDVIDAIEAIYTFNPSERREIKKFIQVACTQLFNREWPKDVDYIRIEALRNYIELLKTMRTFPESGSSFSEDTVKLIPLITQISDSTLRVNLLNGYK